MSRFGSLKVCVAPLKVCAAGRGLSVGQLQRLGRPRQLLPPVGELGLQRLASQPLPLPGRVVRVLDAGNSASGDGLPAEKASYSAASSG